MIIKVKTLIFCENFYEYGDVHVMMIVNPGVLKFCLKVTHTLLKDWTSLFTLNSYVTGEILSS